MMMEAEVVKFDIWIFGSNALCALALNLMVFLVIGRTGAITVRMAGVIKDWILIGLSTVLFPDSQITVMNAVGYSVGNLLPVHQIHHMETVLSKSFMWSFVQP
jgi:hypothetical protein